MSTAPSRKGSTSDAPVKQTSTVVAKSKETASKASAQDDAICPERELLVDDDSKAITCDVCSKWFYARLFYSTCKNISDTSPRLFTHTWHWFLSGLVTVAHQVGHPGPGSCGYQLLACCQKYWAASLFVVIGPHLALSASPATLISSY